MADDTTAEIVFSIAAILLFLGSPFILLAAIFSCIACHRTRKWKKEKALRLMNTDSDVEREALVEENNDDASDVDSIDSGDEEEAKALEEANKADWNLTTRQKFRKELKRAWCGIPQKVQQRQREREEAAKIAKAVAKGIARHERKRERMARKAQQSAEQGESSRIAAEDGLPSYNKAVAAINDDKR